MASPVVFWDPAMLRYDLGGHHPLHPLRWELTWSLADRLHVLDAYDIRRPTTASDDALALIHTTAYIDTVRRASNPGGEGRPLGYFGHGLGPPDNPVFDGMHESAALIAGASIDAAAAIASGQVDRAVNFAGGLHHAMADGAAGFCVYNDAALAIRTMLDAGVRRVAYIDVDVHHGDGVQAAFYDDPRVLTVSIHESPMSLWPGTGWPTECGDGDAAGTAVNIAVPAGSGDAAWLRAFHAVVPGVVRGFRPEVLVTQHGADSHREDPLANLNLTVDGHRAADLALRDLARSVTGGRWLALGGGGYELVRVVPRSWTHLLAIVADHDMDPRTAMPEGWTAEAIAARPWTDPPLSMTDNPNGSADPARFEPWDGHADTPIDRAITETRLRVYPLHGLDPHDPRD